MFLIYKIKKLPRGWITSADNILQTPWLFNENITFFEIVMFSKPKLKFSI